jgi:acyl-CoA reductase-like NAD-dependent aldehyde dehydrogenase|tara:strand:- start:8358 stop:8888 length:531 start_codon:yes stop_codon:yes gene_type:complete
LEIIEALTAQSIAAELSKRPVRHLVDGTLRTSPTKVDVVNPATGRPAAKSPRADKALLNETVHAAHRALPAWQATPIAVRREKLLEASAVLRQHAKELGGLITLEQGKPIDKAIGEVNRAAFLLDQIVSIPLDTEILREDEAGRVELHYRAIGVVGAIAPWNVPIGLAVPKIVHAL